MPMQDWSTFVQPLQIPINGKTYTVPPVTIEGGLQLDAIESGNITAEGVTNADLWRLLLGPVYDEMKADDVPFHAFKRAALTAMFDHKLGRESAEKFWEEGAAPKVLEDLTAAAQLVEEATERLIATQTSPPDSPQSPSTE